MKKITFTVPCYNSQDCFKFFIHYYIPSYLYNRGILLRPLSNKFKTFTKYRILYCKNLFFLLEKKFKAKYSSLATCNDFIYILSD